MTQEELKKVLSERETIERNIERKHTDVALDKSLCNRQLVASQVKYLQRAKSKLPEFYEARCIIPPLAFEQCSSEAAAAHKRIEGESVLELTCGLGVDAVALSRRFKRVVTIEINSVLAVTVRENLRRLNIENVEVVTGSAEEYLRSCRERFDWVYVDPDRRSEDGRKLVLLEDCRPNILSLQADIERVSDRLAVKCSPLFDVDEAFRLFPRSSVETVSLGDECKEVIIYVDGGEGERGERVGATAIGRGEVWVDRAEQGDFITAQVIDLECYKYIILPDVALQKSRLARRVLGEICSIWSDNGVGFMSEEEYAKYDAARHLGRVMRVDWMGEYEPKRVRKELSIRDIKSAEIYKRECSMSNAQIAKQMKIKEGGRDKIVVAKLQNRMILAILQR
ncbi:MAG: RsmD family RNA methyltransferase [Rikenellaceae bacterium]